MNEQHIIAARFQIGERIGTGGMGDVFRGVDLATGDRIAIKALKPEVVKEAPEMLERFAREGEALRQLNHPNIVKVLESVQEIDRHYIVMELVENGSLSDWLKDQAQFPLTRLLSIALELSDALSRAHHLRIIHRDIKPGNVLLALDGTPRLTDFGVARIGSVASITDAGMMIGTLSYLSPESFAGATADSRTDIWAFGVLLYEMATGRRPFDESNTGMLVNAIVNRAYPDLRQFRPDVPAALVDLISRMLTKNPQDRISSMRQIGAELEAIIEGIPTPLRAMLPPPSLFDTQITPTRISHNLPAQTTPFVGREKELTAIEKLVESPDVRLVTLLGPGGMGKTRLSLEAAMRQLQANHFANGVYFVPLAPLNTPDLIATTIGCDIDFCLNTGADDRQQLLDYLREKNILLVLDNFEHLIEGAGIVHDILETAPGVKVIATSRERLNLQSETIYSVSGMNFSGGVFDNAEEYEAMQLFLQSARRVQPNFVLTPQNLGQVAQICRRVEGMPLGIELAAAWVGALSLPDIVKEINECFDFLETDFRDVPERQRSVRAVFDYSWRLLSPDEKMIFKKVAVFRGGFTRKAGQEVTGASLRDLTALVNKSLLQRHQESGRYAIHEVLRQYAEYQLDDDPVLSQQTRDQHCAYYANALRERASAIKSNSQVAVLDEIESDIENVRAAWEWAVDQRHFEWLGQMVIALTDYLFIRRLNEAHQLMANAIPQLENAVRTDADRAVFADLLMVYGSTYNQLGNPREAHSWLQKSLAIARPLNDPAQLGAILRYLSFSAHLVGYTEESRPLAEESLMLRQRAEETWGIADSLFNLGRMITYEGDLTEGVKILEKSLALHRSLGNQRWGTAYAVYQLGMTHFAMGDFDRAWQLLNEDMHIIQQVRWMAAIAQTPLDMAEVATALGEYDLAISFLRESAEKCKTFGLINDQAYALVQLALVLTLAGQTDEAQAIIKGIPEANGNYIVGHRTYTLAQIAYLNGDYAAAEAGFEEALQGWRITSSMTGLSWMLVWFAMTKIRRGNLAGGRDLIAASLKQPFNPVIIPVRLTSLYALALLLNASDQPERAVEIAELVAHHPMTEHPYRMMAVSLLADLQTRLDPAIFKAAHERGQKLEAETVIKAFLAES